MVVFLQVELLEHGIGLMYFSRISTTPSTPPNLSMGDSVSQENIVLSLAKTDGINEEPRSTVFQPLPRRLLRCLSRLNTTLAQLLVQNCRFRSTQGFVAPRFLQM